MISEKHPEDSQIEFFDERYELLTTDATGPVELDLGCGVGRFTTELARKFPERLILGADVMRGRLRKLIKRNARLGVPNCRVLRIEARLLVGRLLMDASLDRIHLLCPDPWPKGRHRGHRLLTSDFAMQLHRVLKPDGVFHFSSDDEAYCAAVQRILTASGIFREFTPAPGETLDVYSDFELRWRSEGRRVTHLYCRKLPLAFSGKGH